MQLYTIIAFVFLCQWKSCGHPHLFRVRIFLRKIEMHCALHKWGDYVIVCNLTDQFFLYSALFNFFKLCIETSKAAV